MCASERARICVYNVPACRAVYNKVTITIYGCDCREISLGIERAMNVQRKEERGEDSTRQDEGDDVENARCSRRPRKNLRLLGAT